MLLLQVVSTTTYVLRCTTLYVFIVVVTIFIAAASAALQKLTTVLTEYSVWPSLSWYESSQLPYLFFDHHSIICTASCCQNKNNTCMIQRSIMHTTLLLTNKQNSQKINKLRSCSIAEKG
jgi:hypothetical protein